MTLAAEVKHHAPGRMRLRLVGPRFDPKDFRETVSSISKTHSFRRVRSNSLNRTILIEADDELSLQTALEGLTRKEILEVQAETNQSLSSQFEGIKAGVDDFIYDVTSGGLNLKRLSAILLMGLGAKQFASGNFLPAGLSLIFYGVEILNLPRTDERRER